MSKIIICRGVPASGKSTWAKEWVAGLPETRIRVNRDDIRYSMFGRGSGVDEMLISDVQTSMLESAMRRGLDIVLDNTNLVSRHVRDILQLAVKHQYEVEFKDFEISVDAAIARDARREVPVGAPVIRMFFSRFIQKGKLPRIPELSDANPSGSVITPYVPDTTKPAAFIFDIDGTLAHINTENPRDIYDASRAHEDTLDRAVSEVLISLALNYNKIILMSGRSEDHRTETETWLATHGLAELHEGLLMRASGDKRKDSVVKNELFQEYVANRYNVVGVFDDRPQVVRLWRELGIRVFNVGDGVEF